MSSFLNRGWVQTGFGGVILFVVIREAISFTGNPNFMPTYMLVGSFVVPLTFLAYFYSEERRLDRKSHHGLPLNQISMMFLMGGALGTLTAGTLEYLVPSANEVATFLSVGFIEEAVKLIFPMIVFLQAKYTSEADGLVFGVATGMGFAALETLGYALTALMSPVNSFTALEQVLIVRGLVSPLGHAAWTGLVCGTMWHYRNHGLLKLGAMTLLYYVVAALLHFVWNMGNASGSTAIAFTVMAVVGVISLILVFRHLADARRIALIEVVQTAPSSVTKR